jgi:acyl-coenzyme A thioesterase PaaI-like protein
LSFDRTHEELFIEMMEILRGKLGKRLQEYRFPPPIFEMMKGELLDMNVDEGTLSAKFPIFERYQNPYGIMQGGMIAAAVDNTIGPLSVLVSPLNVTRSLEIKYSQPVRPEMAYFVVRARYLERIDHWLYFGATVFSPQEKRLVRCKALHWIIEDDVN